MNPIYLDLHIHTSDNEDDLNQNYDVDLLLKKINETSNDSDFLISLTDHNTINKSAYLKLLEKTQNVILGVELHIRNAETKPPYHCHMYFNLNEISVEKIDNINIKLIEFLNDGQELESTEYCADITTEEQEKINEMVTKINGSIVIANQSTILETEI